MFFDLIIVDVEPTKKKLFKRRFHLDIRKFVSSNTVVDN